MGTRDLIDGNDWSNADLSDVTIEELIDEYGEGVVRRGLSYMDSLQEADQNYRKSADYDEYAEENARAMGADPEKAKESEGMKEAGEQWQRGMEESGLGIENDG